MNKYFTSQNISYTHEIHFHKEIEIIYVKKGESVYTINDKTYCVKSNNILIIFPYQLHSCKYISSDCVHQILNFNMDFIEDFSIRFAEYYFEAPLFCSKEINIFTKKSFNMIDILSQCEENSSFYKEKGYLTVILGDLFFKHELSKRASSSDIRILLKAESLLEENHSIINTNELFHKLGITQTTFKNALKNTLNISLTSFININRINYAIELLATSNLSITDIIYESGFNSTQSFFRQFKKTTGITPGKYKKEKKLQPL